MQTRTLIRNRARALRKSMSEPEVMLWSRLRGRDGARPIFRRQQPIGSVIVDFFCPAARLAIEVDGSSHWDDEMRRRDCARDRWLEGQGIEVMRIPASRIYADLSGAVDGILTRALECAAAGPRERLSPSTNRSSLRSAVGPPPPSQERWGR